MNKRNSMILMMYPYHFVAAYKRSSAKLNPSASRSDNACSVRFANRKSIAWFYTSLVREKLFRKIKRETHIVKNKKNIIFLYISDYTYNKKKRYMALVECQRHTQTKALYINQASWWVQANDPAALNKLILGGEVSRTPPQW